ncbi:MAG TPA: tetratricopeptide repeat protein, partial [Salinimicrobium sp.]|nr:tetratricopeptide repeat protein [Salinimicrobium sp.]
MKFFFSLLLILAFWPSLSAQKISSEKKFEMAKEQAAAGNYEIAIEALKELADAIPENKDFQIYLARVYGWNNNYSEAISILEPLVEAENFKKEVMEVLVTTHLWAGNYEEVVFYSNRALKIYPDNFFRLKKALALAELERNIEALSVLEEILQENPDHRDAIALQTLLFNKKKNQLA